MFHSLPTIEWLDQISRKDDNTDSELVENKMRTYSWRDEQMNQWADIVESIVDFLYKTMSSSESLLQIFVFL